MNAAIEAVGLCKAYGDLVAVDDVSLSLPPGEMFGILGPDAGFTVVLTLLAGRLFRRDDA